MSLKVYQTPKQSTTVCYTQRQDFATLEIYHSSHHFIFRRLSVSESFQTLSKHPGALRGFDPNPNFNQFDTGGISKSDIKRGRDSDRVILKLEQNCK